MSFILISIACILFYGKSKYFPKNLTHVSTKIKDNWQIARIAGYLLFLLAAILLCLQLGIGTGLVVFFTALSLLFCLTLIVLPLNKGYIYLIATLSLLIIIFENII
ncbi:MAG: hypothetical protein AAF705_04615 [Bacteroidota bacterium]